MPSRSAVRTRPHRPAKRTAAPMRAAIGALFAGLAFPPTAGAQSVPETHGDWVVQCADAGNQANRCQMAQTLTADGTGQHVMTMIVRPADGADGLAALVRLPHGLYLPGGIALRVDGSAPMTALIQTSDASGVYASVPLPADIVDAMKAGRSLTVAMQSVKREPIALDVSLAGFTAASAALAARTGRD